VTHFGGQPILAATGFQPVLFDRGRVSFRRDARSEHFPPTVIASGTVALAVLPPVLITPSVLVAPPVLVAPAVLPPVIFLVANAR
jgi:hypothetical protein